jgi:N6-adenosine-specific RNA methylase IME4
VNVEDAEEYTQALGQVVAGGWRQVALGERLGVPKALGLSTREWVEARLGGYVRQGITERREVVPELIADGFTQRQAADILGVHEAQISRDLANASGAESGEPSTCEDIAEVDSPLANASPLDAVAGLAIGQVRESERKKAEARTREPAPVLGPVQPPPGKHRCVVIDPPWPMQKIERDERPNQGQSLDYPTMPVFCLEPSCSPADEYSEAKRAPCYEYALDQDDTDECPPCNSIECVVGHALGGLAHDDAHIYLWVTHKFMPDGLELLRQWGFNYQCVMTWRKNVGITPYSWMYDTEHVLFGRRGNLPLDRLGLRLSFDAPTQGHSVKPDVFYDRVREASLGPRVDMFPGVKHDGFEPWGLEASHRDVV